jgi:integrase
MASLGLRGNRWYIFYRLNGQQRRISTGCGVEDRIGAEIRLREFKDSGGTSKAIPKPSAPVTLAELIQQFHQYQGARGVTTKQANGNRMRVTRLCSMAKVDSIDQLTEASVEMALASLRRATTSKKANPSIQPLLSPRSRNVYRKSLMAFLRWCERNRQIKENPLALLRCENEEIDIRHRRSALSESEFTLLCDAAQSSACKVEGMTGPERCLAYRVTAATGLRRGELASLTAGSFRLNGEHPEVVVDATCSKRRRRDALPVASFLVEELKTALASIAGDGHLFPGLRSKKTHLMIKADLSAAGLNYQTQDGAYRDWHSLRHLFVTRMWKSGAAPHTVKELARHSDFRLTMRYAHNSSQELYDAVNNIPKLGA